MKKILSTVIILLATTSLAACGDTNVPRKHFVLVDYIVVESITKSQSCYLRMRPAATPTAAPRLFGHRFGDPGSVQRSLFERCAMSKPGDMVSRQEVVTVPATPPKK